MLKALSDITFAIKSAFDSKSAFRYHFWMKKCKVGAFGKPHIFVCAKRVGSRWIDSYIFAHGAEAKRTLSHLAMHGVVVRGTFCFLRMNPFVGIGVSITRNCSETNYAKL